MNPQRLVLLLRARELRLRQATTRLHEARAELARREQLLGHEQDRLLALRDQRLEQQRRQLGAGAAALLAQRAAHIVWLESAMLQQHAQVERARVSRDQALPALEQARAAQAAAQRRYDALLDQQRRRRRSDARRAERVQDAVADELSMHRHRYGRS